MLFSAVLVNIPNSKVYLKGEWSIRGNTDLESNIYQFDLDKARSDKGLKLLLDEKHYVTVHDVLMEKEQMLVLNARRHLKNNILSKAFYSILSDESSDVSKKEQLSFSVRICHENYEVPGYTNVLKGSHPMHYFIIRKIFF